MSPLGLKTGEKGGTGAACKNGGEREASRSRPTECQGGWEAQDGQGGWSVGGSQGEWKRQRGLLLHGDAEQRGRMHGTETSQWPQEQGRQWRVAVVPVVIEGRQASPRRAQPEWTPR